MITRKDVMSSRRLALSVKRYHTWPTIQQQTVADHTCQLLRIYAEIFGPPEAEVTMYILEHDMEELHTGDLPYPVKVRYPGVREALRPVEEDARHMLGTSKRQLWEELHKRVKVCDLLEMHEFGQVEVALGNRLAEPIVTHTGSAAIELAGEISVQLRTDVQRRVDSGRY